ncbi:hypothetical protein LIER_31399 [Lithospermum erythrorhizon]|uniref:F-box associated domain-containing protein n=1 Tax=Lithospermum erythrorhizon TaxID=34254 RepID=A0AAV3RUI5_LITER
MYDPVVVDMYLHWMVDLPLGDSRINPCINAVMIFDFNSEEIYTMPHPKVDGHWRCQVTNLFDNHEKMMILFEMDKKLWFAHISQQGGTGMDIWELHDHENWSWVRRYNICKSQISKRTLTHDDMDTRLYTSLLIPEV